MPAAVLDAIQARDIRGRYAAGGITMRVLAADYGVSFCAVQRVLRGVRPRLTCAHCGVSFEGTFAVGQLYCGDRCQWQALGRRRHARGYRQPVGSKARAMEAFKARNPSYWTEYERSHPEESLRKHHLYRARKAGVEVGDVDFAAILREHGCVCHICGGAIAPSALTFDHVNPLSQGGPHVQSNIRPAHMPCNSRKGNRIQ